MTLQVAELAGIMGAKHTCFLIPLCHNISLKYGVFCLGCTAQQWMHLACSCMSPTLHH